MGPLLGNLENVCLPGFERKEKNSWVLLMDPADIKILSLGAIWNFSKGTGFKSNVNQSLNNTVHLVHAIN